MLPSLRGMTARQRPSVVRSTQPLTDGHTGLTKVLQGSGVAPRSAARRTQSVPLDLRRLPFRGSVLGRQTWPWPNPCPPQSLSGSLLLPLLLGRLERSKEGRAKPQPPPGHRLVALLSLLPAQQVS